MRQSPWAWTLALGVCLSAVSVNGVGVASTASDSPPQLDGDIPVGSATYPNGDPGQAAIESTAICTVTAWNPYTNPAKTAVKGDGEQFCSGAFLWQKIVVEVQQYRALGYWATKASVSSGRKTNIFIYETVSWLCGAGSGNQLYRIVTYGSFKDMNLNIYSQAVQSEKELRVTCPP